MLFDCTCTAGWIILNLLIVTITMNTIIIIIIILSPLCRASTIIEMKQTIFLGCRSVAAILWLQFMVHVMLLPMTNVLCLLLLLTP